MSSGTVFSIEEFAIHDGPGVRTTVFLKGCPLSCVWCHSPEGQGFSAELIRSPNGCLSCGACLKKGEEHTGIPSLVPESASVCPRSLIRTAGERFEASALVARILKNADFMRSAGGGVTFSGGEPLAQPIFLRDCLTLLEGKLHRALQTSGFAEPDVFASLLPHCDFLLFDLKIYDEAKHRTYCGQSNRSILSNYQTLAASGKEFITRIPLIPTLTDTEENLTSIAALLHRCGVHQAELLPYQPLSGSKYAMTGRRYAPPFDETLTPMAHESIFKSFGIEVRTI